MDQQRIIESTIFPDSNYLEKEIRSSDEIVKK